MRRRRERPLTPEEEAFYAGFKPMPIPGRTLEIGCRVRIEGDHPHAGRVGTLESVENTVVGPGLVIRFDDGDGGMVFNRGDHRLVILHGPNRVGSPSETSGKEGRDG